MAEPEKSYYQRLRESGENLAGRVKQASSRAYLYGLEDDGASGLARRKRAVKDAIATRKSIIVQIEKRQAGKTRLLPRPQDEADRVIAAHREAIRRLEEKNPDIGPSVNVIAPMARRVAREDRRRARKTKTTERKP